MVRLQSWDSLCGKTPILVCQVGEVHTASLPRVVAKIHC